MDRVCGSCSKLGVGELIGSSDRQSTATDLYYKGFMCGECRNPTTLDFKCDKEDKFEYSEETEQILKLIKESKDV